MNRGNAEFRFIRIIGLGLALIVAACSSSSSGIDKKNPPTGGTPTEFGFQYAQVIAKNGNCDQALPIFICLGEQGAGWELAVHSGGMCALEAAKLWTEPLGQRPGFFSKRSVVSFDKPYFRSKTALNEKGLSLLHSAAAAGWPDSQAALTRILGAAGNVDTDLSEAKLWLARYDRNPRRKIYGSNTLDKDLRSQLASIDLPPASDALWDKKQLMRGLPQDKFCQQLIRTRPQQQGLGTPEQDEVLPGSLPEPETVDQSRQRQQRRR